MPAKGYPASYASRDPEVILKAIRGSKGIKRVVCRRLGINRHTLSNWMQKYSAIRKAMIREREEIIDIAEEGLLNHLENGEWKAIQYTLSSLGRRRGWGVEIETTMKLPPGFDEEWLIDLLVELAEDSQLGPGNVYTITAPELNYRILIAPLAPPNYDEPPLMIDASQEESIDQ